MEFTTALTDAECERLAILAEEMAEAIQVIGKILRHGFESHNPLNASVSPSNREMLETEVGHVEHAIGQMVDACDMNAMAIRVSRAEKAKSIARWLHFQSAETEKE